MICFYPTIAAKMPPSPNYGSAFADSEEERKALLDRLLTKTGWNRCRKRGSAGRAADFPRVSSRRRGLV